MTHILISYRGFANETEIVGYTTKAHADQEMSTINDCTNAWARDATPSEVQRAKRRVIRNNKAGAGDAMPIDVTHRLNNYGDIYIAD